MNKAELDKLKKDDLVGIILDSENATKLAEALDAVSKANAEKEAAQKEAEEVKAKLAEKTALLEAAESEVLSLNEEVEELKSTHPEAKLMPEGVYERKNEKGEKEAWRFKIGRLNAYHPSTGELMASSNLIKDAEAMEALIKMGAGNIEKVEK